MHLIATPLHFISFDIVSCWCCCCTLYMDVVRANRQHSLRIQMPVLKPATTFNHIGWTLVYLYSNYGCVVLCCAVLCYVVQWAKRFGQSTEGIVMYKQTKTQKTSIFFLSDWNSIRLASLQHTKRSQLFVCCAHDIYMQSILFTRTTTTKQLAINTDTCTNARSLLCTIRSVSHTFARVCVPNYT